MPWVSPSGLSCPHRVQSNGTSLQTPQDSSARVRSPPLPSPLVGPRTAHGRERRRTGSQGNSNQPWPAWVTRCEITHAEALVQAGFPNGINAVSSPPQCHTLLQRSSPQVLPSTVQLMIFCSRPISGTLSTPSTHLEGRLAGVGSCPAHPLNESFTARAGPRVDMQSRQRAPPPPSLQVHGRGDRSQAGVQALTCLNFDFDILFDHGNAAAASRLTYISRKSLLGCEQTRSMVLAPGAFFFLSQRVSQTRARFLCCPAKLYVPKNARPALPRPWARLGSNGSCNTCRPSSRRHSACGAVKHTRQAEPGRQIGASPCQLPGIRTLDAERVSRGRARVSVLVVYAQNRHAPPHSPSQLVQAHNCASTSAPLSTSLPQWLRDSNSMHSAPSKAHHLREGSLII